MYRVVHITHDCTHDANNQMTSANISSSLLSVLPRYKVIHQGRAPICGTEPRMFNQQRQCTEANRRRQSASTTGVS